MQTIKGILFEPVGCLAEFPAEPFLAISSEIAGKKHSSKSGSRAYWHLLNLIESGSPIADELERQAVERASVYEDVVPALAELKAMGVKLCVASSLSAAAVSRFLQAHRLAEYFDIVHSRDSAGGVKAAPLACALGDAGLAPEHTMFLTDTAEGLKVASGLGLNSILMMNDPDEALRLALKNPSGGIVSLHELPDFVRLVAANARA